MPLTNKGTEILSAMQKKYGEEKGKSVFYASKNSGKITGVDAADMNGEEWEALEKLFGEWIAEEKKEPEHGASDAEPLYASVPAKSARRYDDNGYLHVKDCPISKARVNPYRGDEIPNYEVLGLEPNKIYYLLRAPDELANAANSFDNMPLLTRHVTQSAADPRQDLRVGSTGTGTRFDPPYLRTDLVIWDNAPIAGVEHEVQRELSSSYRYDADMVPGEYQGTKYDGVMRNIRGNHVALVSAGRAGSDVAVADEGDFIMPVPQRSSGRAILALGAITGFVAPRLAADQRCDMTALRTILKATSDKNWLQQKPRLATALATATHGKFQGAADADLDDIHRLLDSLDGENSMSGDADPDDDGMAGDAEETEEEKRERMERRAEDRKAGRDCAADEEEETEEEKEHRKEARDRRAKDKRMGKDAEPKDRGDAEKEHKAEDRKAWDRRMGARDSRRGGAHDDMISRTAMDAAIRDAETRTIKRMEAMAEARQLVRPIVGDVGGSEVGMDSADKVYRFALEHLGVDLTGVPASAFRPMLQREIHHSQAAGNRMANDRDPFGGGGRSDGFDAWLPKEAARISN